MSSYIKIHKKKDNLCGSISITGSKSISNRLLILKALYEKDIHIDNISNSEDTKILQENLTKTSNLLDIHHAGTAMRFLTSYFSIQEGKEVVLTGSDRMKERPIYVLVEALKRLGGKIFYLEKIGYPPIKIIGKKIIGGEIDINAKVSSQYISSLMLISSKFQKGLKLYLKEKITSIPYIKMTLKLLSLAGINISWEGKIIHIFPGKEKGNKYFSVESDWSSSSYYYSMASIVKKSNISLKNYTKDSLQGDRKVSSIYDKYFGVSTIFHKNEIRLHKKCNFLTPKKIILDLNKTPDLAQTIAVTCSALKIKCHLKGLETLKIKETDRLYALKNELLKFGVKVIITNSCLKIHDFFLPDSRQNIKIKTYQDHRMAMSFTPFCFFSSIKIEDPKVVEKSYPNFWTDLQNLNFSINFCDY
ncbi:3-phosphoshikimate 1-carboxyvinyltransferase [Blattabacterium cuenoti]|uniref:3-phosphoshikimate 1-carboxyvinyltransferase n=1 Tax=Blattabacterium cuenoti TaxID=1653831 RepID=UPI00163C1983|nr:3-phosphoshikimate 1-carboxyvinyltransferase [Blattabacterium cuenoti]